MNNVSGARAIFERWMRWAPKRNAWIAYVKMEMRHGDGDGLLQRIRDIFERFLLCHPEVSSYLEYAKYEMKYGEPAKARTIYERCSTELAEDIVLENDKLFQAFATFEERMKEVPSPSPIPIPIAIAIAIAIAISVSAYSARADSNDLQVCLGTFTEIKILVLVFSVRFV